MHQYHAHKHLVSQISLSRFCPLLLIVEKVFFLEIKLSSAAAMGWLARKCKNVAL